MKTTTNIKELKELNACESGYVKFKEAHGDKEVKLSEALESNGWDDIWWFISAAYSQFTDEQKHDLRMYGCNRALLNIEKIKPYCSDNDYELIVNYLNTGDESAARSAESAARSAESAARSAESAARSAAESAARSAAESAARSAARSAESAARSAESAAWSTESAAWSAARSAAMKENEQLLMELFIKWESQ